MVTRSPKNFKWVKFGDHFWTKRAFSWKFWVSHVGDFLTKKKKFRNLVGFFPKLDGQSSVGFHFLYCQFQLRYKSTAPVTRINCEERRLRKLVELVEPIPTWPNNVRSPDLNTCATFSRAKNFSTLVQIASPGKNFLFSISGILQKCNVLFPKKEPYTFVTKWCHKAGKERC